MTKPNQSSVIFIDKKTGEKITALECSQDGEIYYFILSSYYGQPSYFLDEKEFTKKYCEPGEYNALLIKND